MKRWVSLFLAACAVGMLCTLTGCENEKRFQTIFPLAEETVTEMLEKVELPGVISESETDSYAKGHIVYVIRSTSETYDSTETLKFLASIGSANYDGERALLTSFDQSVTSEQIVWEDWKKQIVLATLLYGGFEEEEVLYQSLLERETQDSQGPLVWEVLLTGGYCRVSYQPRNNTVYDDDGFAVKKQSAILGVNIYESRGLYEKLKNG